MVIYNCDYMNNEGDGKHEIRENGACTDTTTNLAA